MGTEWCNQIGNVFLYKNREWNLIFNYKLPISYILVILFLPFIINLAPYAKNTDRQSWRDSHAGYAHG